MPPPTFIEWFQIEDYAISDFNGMAVDPTTGDLLVIERDAFTLRRLSTVDGSELDQFPLDDDASPRDVTVAADGSIWISFGTEPARIQHFSSTGTVLASYFTAVFPGEPIENVVAITFGPGADLFVVSDFTTLDVLDDVDGNSVRRERVYHLDPSDPEDSPTLLVNTGRGVAGTFPTQTWTYPGSPPNGQVIYPQDVTFDGSGNMYVSCWLYKRIQKFAAGTYTYVSSFGGGGSGDGQFGDAGDPDGHADYSQGWQRMKMAFDPFGDLHVVDFIHGRVQVFNTSGVFQYDYGTLSPTSLTDPGEFWEMRGIAIASDGTVYIGDASGDINVWALEAAGASPVRGITVETCGDLCP